MADKSLWQKLHAPMELGSVASEVADAAYFAKYPAELADSLVKDAVRLMECEWRPFFSVSDLMNSPSWWRLFHSLLPECPLDPQVFIEFTAGWFSSRIEPKKGGGFKVNADWDHNEWRTYLEPVLVELRLFSMWLEATGRWEDRPEDSVKDDQEKRRLIASVQRLRREISRHGALPAKELLKEARCEAVHLKILGILELYTYKRERDELKSQAQALIDKYSLTAADVTG